MSTGQVLITGKLLELWQAAHTEAAKNNENLVGLFRGWMPEGFGTTGKPRILYVGKATSGKFDERDAEQAWFNSKQSFWTFARLIATKLNCSTQTLDCIVWSNISKISTTGIEAERKLLKNLGTLPADSLQQEITESNAQIIVLTAAHFCDPVIREIAGSDSDEVWTKSEDETTKKVNDVWWMQRPDGRWLLWMRHPQGAKSELLDYAASKVADLLSSPR